MQLEPMYVVGKSDLQTRLHCCRPLRACVPAHLAAFKAKAK